ncbi:hypothetical protein SBV1_960008 [Verrucomicrobia bacterium]|nr:hypothetical protein SBV1_960008 [Verrucomicrobiota bacterium]
MQVTIGKLLSLLIAIAYAVVAIKYNGIAGAKWSLGLLLPLALIWFPEELGSLTGYYKSGYVNVQTPGPIVAFIGWFILVGLPVLLYLVLKHAI